MAGIPSVQTLRAFEAAGRHQSYSQAARELGLTHSAISHRIRELESRHKVALFRRSGNRMLVTSEGQRLLVQVRMGLSVLEVAFRGKERARARWRIALGVLPAFAMHWLGPRLKSLREALPTVELDVHASEHTSDLTAEGLEAAIRFGPGEWPDVHSRRLSGEILFPVCSPTYRARLRIRRIQDLRRCILLRHPRQAWSAWFRTAGVAISEPETGSCYSDAGLLLQAAAADEGVALARGLMVLDYLRSAELVRLFPHSMPDPYSYCLVRPVNASPKPALAALERWLITTIGKDARELARFKVRSVPD